MSEHAAPATRDWDPQQYRRFADERLAPLLDLLGLVDTDAVARVADLGCGPGEMTVRIAETLGATDVCGVDNSETMLAAAAAHATDTIRFESGDLAAWTSDADYDLVIANASLQWVPDHPGVLARWRAALRPGGQLAVQIPAAAGSLTHTASARLAETEPYRSAFGPDGPGPDPLAANLLDAETYARVLYDLGFAEQHVSLRIYPHVLADVDAAVDWMRGTGLLRYKRHLDDNLYARFVADYAAALRADWGDVSPLFFPFPRILIWGRLPA